jgi:hypothetical protein
MPPVVAWAEALAASSGVRVKAIVRNADAKVLSFFPKSIIEILLQVILT